MKILIAGCGEVGETLAYELSLEGYDLTLMDSDPHVLETGFERFDVMSLQGNCASVKSLLRAGVKKCNLLIACTGSDELNLLSCLTARSLNPKLHTIARIRDPEYMEQVYSMRESFGISMTFNPERDAATEIERLIKYPGFLSRETFMGGRAEVAELRIDGESPLCGVPLSSLDSILKCRVLVCAVLRDGIAVIPDGKFVLEAGDRIFVTASTDNLSVMLKSLGIVTKKARRIVIAGGGMMSYYLAKNLKNSEVMIIERDIDRCRELSELLPRVTVVNGTVRNHSFLESEGVTKADALVSLTELDELNVITSLFASRHKIPMIITKIGKPENAGFIENLSLGSVISPGRFSCNAIVRYVRAMRNRGGAASAIHSIADGQAEAMEFLVDPDTLYCDTPLKQVRLKKNVRLACIARGNEVIVPNGDSYFSEGDSVIVAVKDGVEILDLNDIFA
ncbi:MAG: Trk system potassium transporter TrkA [Ruminococcaceae bacterium]|nr:Trk system potassium transporter TrkA [Oscillospiraceae bacterium]